MAREVIERCDVCRRVVSEPLKDERDRSVYGDGRGYTVRHKRIVWSFSSARWWHRRDAGPFLVCDRCWDKVRELAASPAPEEAD